MDMRISYRGGYKYQLVRIAIFSTDVKPPEPIRTDFISLDVDGLLTVLPGYAWDGPSGPTFDTANFMRGSLVHDALYQLLAEGLLAKGWREKADRMLQQICLEDGMTHLRAWWVYQAVRFAGGPASRKAREILSAP